MRLSAEPLRILICEDETITAMQLRNALTLGGHQIVGVTGMGTECVELALSLRPDLILMDLNMSDISGLEATESIMAQAPTAIVMLTAYHDTASVTQALAAGVCAFLVKPLAGQQLLPTLRVACARFRESQELARENALLREAANSETTSPTP